jgi:heme-degrading monooxygenase HmoA
MYTRVVELTSKSGKARDLCNTIDDKVLPILKRQAGFVDEAVIVSDTEPNRVLALSFWNTREDAQRYQREQFDTVQQCRRRYSTCSKLRLWFVPLMSTLRPPTNSLQKKPPETIPPRTRAGQHRARPTLCSLREETLTMRQET